MGGIWEPQEGGNGGKNHRNKARAADHTDPTDLQQDPPPQIVCGGARWWFARPKCNTPTHSNQLGPPSLPSREPHRLPPKGRSSALREKTSRSCSPRIVPSLCPKNSESLGTWREPRGASSGRSGRGEAGKTLSVTCRDQRVPQKKSGDICHPRSQTMSAPSPQIPRKAFAGYFSEGPGG